MVDFCSSQQRSVDDYPITVSYQSIKAAMTNLGKLENGIIT